MAAEGYIQDLSEYLTGNESPDFVLKFGEKSWPIHCVLANSHSRWFRNAITRGFKEGIDKEVTLDDSPEFADAIDCMVSYFYNANYDTSKYDASESLLHTQVAIIADKYDCASLYRLAKTSFANAVEAVKGDDWAAVAPLIYDYTTTELQAHKELRRTQFLMCSRTLCRDRSFWMHTHYTFTFRFHIGSDEITAVDDYNSGETTAVNDHSSDQLTIEDSDLQTSQCSEGEMSTISEDELHH